MQTAPKRRRQFRDRTNRFSMFLVVVVVLTIIGVVAVREHTLKAKMAANADRIEILQSQIDAQSSRTEEIAEYEKYTHTKGFVEDVAHDKLGLVYEGEILFKPDE